MSLSRHYSVAELHGLGFVPRTSMRLRLFSGLPWLKSGWLKRSGVQIDWLMSSASYRIQQIPLKTLTIGCQKVASIQARPKHFHLKITSGINKYIIILILFRGWGHHLVVVESIWQKLFNCVNCINIVFLLQTTFYFIRHSSFSHKLFCLTLVWNIN